MIDLKKCASLENAMENEEIFLNELKKLLELENIDKNFVLAGNELWDSLAIVSTVALFDQIFKKRVSGETIVKCTTVSKLLELV